MILASLSGSMRFLAFWSIAMILNTNSEEERCGYKCNAGGASFSESCFGRFAAYYENKVREWQKRCENLREVYEKKAILCSHECHEGKSSFSKDCFGDHTAKFEDHVEKWREGCNKQGTNKPVKIRCEFIRCNGRKAVFSRACFGDHADEFADFVEDNQGRCGRTHSTSDKYSRIKKSFPNWSSPEGKAYWVAHINGEDECEDVDFNSCVVLAKRKCTSDEACSYFAVPLKKAARNEYGYNLYDKSAGSVLKKNDDWTTFKKVASNVRPYGEADETSNDTVRILEGSPGNYHEMFLLEYEEEEILLNQNEEVKLMTFF